MLHRLRGHEQIVFQLSRLTLRSGQLFQRHAAYHILVRAQADHVQLSGTQHLLVGGGQALAGDRGQIGQIAVPLNACGGIAKEFAPGLPHAVQALVVDLAFQLAGQSGLFNFHCLAAEAAVFKVGIKGHAEHNGRVFSGEGLAVQGKPILDARDGNTEHPAGALHAGFHREGRAIQAGQLSGQLGHIRAGGIAPIHHQGQKSLIGSLFPAGGKPEMQRDPAAVEFIRRDAVQMHPRRKAFAL